MTFVGELAIDHGGPRREFFRLFSLQCSETFFRGKAKYFDVNAAAVQVDMMGIAQCIVWYKCAFFHCDYSPCLFWTSKYMFCCRLLYLKFTYVPYSRILLLYIHALKYTCILVPTIR